MSYQVQAQLRDDSVNFQPRVRSAMVEHALSFQPHVTPLSGGDSAEQALARVVVKGGTGLVEELTFFTLVAATPGFVEKASPTPPVPEQLPVPEVPPDDVQINPLSDTGDGAVVDGGYDASQITDEDILAAVQDNWALVVGLWYNEDGTPIP